jgi:DNA-binding transcriptional LysR family regulator
MDLRRLRYFVAVAEDLHFTKAAARLNVAQPALSQAIRRLEAELGVELLQRNRREVKLTFAGSVLLEDARKLLSDGELAASRARAAKDGVIGLLRLGYIDAAVYELMPRLLKRFRSKLPGVTISLFSTPNMEIVHALEAGELDVGILRPPAAGSSLSFEVLDEDELMLAIPASHPLSRCEVVDLSSIREIDVIMAQRPLAPDTYDLIAGLYRESGVEIEVVAHVSTMQAMVSLVGGEMGVAIVPRRVVRWGDDHVVFRPIVPSPPPLRLVVGWSPHHLHAVSASFVEIARGLRPALTA